METIVFCGAGFLGSWAIRFYAQRATAMSVFFPAVIIDGDTFEDRNRPTQNCYPRHMGVSKAEVASDFCGYLELDAIPISTRIGFNDLDAIVERFGPVLVVDTFDNLQSRVVAKFLAEKASCECLHLGLSTKGFGKVEWSGKWSLDPTKTLDFPTEEEEVETPPCELVLFHDLGIQVASRGISEVLAHIHGKETQSWYVTENKKTLL